MKSPPIVFLVQSNDKEECLTRQAITNSGISCEIIVADDGKKACDLLFDVENPLPTLVLLDLRLPTCDGFEVLARIRGNEHTKRLPVIIFSSTLDPLDIERCLDLHANSFVYKDKDFELFETRVKLILYYWIAVNKNVNS